MANVTKEGKLKYFPLDVGFFGDRKVELLRSDNNGILAEYFYLRLLCHIYGDKGYYYEWNEDEAGLWALKLGTTQNTVEMMIKLLCKRSMLNGQLLTQEKVLSSRRIQITYIEACAEREFIRIYGEYALVEEDDIVKFSKKVINKLAFYPKNHEGNEIKPGGNEIKHWFNLQSRVEYIKVDKSRVDDSISIVESPTKTPAAVETVENLLTLSVNNNTEIFTFTDEYIKELKQLYPKADIKIELVKIQNKINKNSLCFDHDNQIKKYIETWLEYAEGNGNNHKFDMDELLEKAVFKNWQKREAGEKV